jgi:hypothetical protein
MTEALVDDFLAHYGIKGMRWGKRKDETPAERDARKAEKKRHNTELGEVLNRRFGLMKSMTQEEYDRLETKGREFSEGATFKRIVGKRNLNADDRYVSTNEQDAFQYRVGLGVKFLGLGERYEVTLKSVNKLTSPSAKERVDAFTDLMDKPSITLKNGNVVTGREFLKSAGRGGDVKRLDSHRLGLKYYNEFISTQYLDAPLNKAYFNEIRRRGYNSLIDDNDAGILAKEPLILLNPKGDVQRMSISPLGKEDVEAARTYFTAPETGARYR